MANTGVNAIWRSQGQSTSSTTTFKTTSLTVNDFNVVSNMSVNNWSAYGNVTVAQNTDISLNLTVGKDFHVYGNILTDTDLYVKNNTYLKNSLYFGTITTDTVSANYGYISGNSVTSNFNITTGTTPSTTGLPVLDIYSNVPTVLRLKTSTTQVKNILAQNVYNQGITNETSNTNASLNFYYGNKINNTLQSQPDSSISASIGTLSITSTNNFGVAANASTLLYQDLSTSNL